MRMPADRVPSIFSNWKMTRLSLRFFLLVCIVFGAVAVPLSHRYYQRRRAAEVNRLAEELADLQTQLAERRVEVNLGIQSSASTSEIQSRIRRIEARLKKLTASGQK